MRKVAKLGCHRSNLTDQCRRLHALPTPTAFQGVSLGRDVGRQALFRPASFYQAENIDVHFGSRCAGINRQKKTVTLADATSIGYGTLVIATGATPVLLPGPVGGDLKHVHYVRTLDDADAMAKDFQPGKRALIVGGGYIGLDAASVARGRGMDVTLIHSSDRILSRVAAQETSSFFRDLHVK